MSGVAITNNWFWKKRTIKTNTTEWKIIVFYGFIRFTIFNRLPSQRSHWLKIISINVRNNSWQLPISQRNNWFTPKLNRHKMLYNLAHVMLADIRINVLRRVIMQANLGTHNLISFDISSNNTNLMYKFSIVNYDV